MYDEHVDEPTNANVGLIVVLYLYSILPIQYDTDSIGALNRRYRNDTDINCACAQLIMHAFKMAARRSPIWRFFTIDPIQENMSVCKICDKKVSRGGKNKR